jgi:hypothetical protein
VTAYQQTKGNEMEPTSPKYRGSMQDEIDEAIAECQAALDAVKATRKARRLIAEARRLNNWGHGDAAMP